MYHKAIDNNSKATDSPDVKQSNVLKVMWETRNKSRINVRGGNCCLWRLSVDITAEAKEQKDLQNHVNLYSTYAVTSHFATYTCSMQVSN